MSAALGFAILLLLAAIRPRDPFHRATPTYRRPPPKLRLIHGGKNNLR